MMNDRTSGSDAGILDILFAVALGEGYLEGVAQNREQILSGAAFSLGPAGQDLYRVALAFLVILLSWIYYRSTTLPGRVYDRGEFAVDALVVITYLTLFVFIDEAIVFAWILVFIWTLYLLARVVSKQRSRADVLLGVAFIGVLGVVALSGHWWRGDVAEWTRLLVMTVVVIVYRPLDRRLLGRTA